MHNTEIKTEIVGPQQQQQLSLHGQSNHLSASPTRRMTNGDGVITTVAGSRHLRDGAASGLVVSSTECAGCGKRITDRFLLKALDLFWHEDCLKCGCCDCRLGEEGSTLYTKANLILCKRDYLRFFGNTGYCAACSKVISAFEMVMRAKNNVYHLECFACQQCNHRFCVGDRFYLCENKILCEYDYEERMVFANMACSPGNLSILRRQPGSEGERPQPQQRNFQPACSNIISNYHSISDHNLRFGQQYKSPVPPPKVPVSEPHVGGNNPYNAHSLPPSSSPPSQQYCAETGYITKKARVRQCSDPFNNEGREASSTPLHDKRPREIQPSDDADGISDNPNSTLLRQIHQHEWNNNNFENNEKPIVTTAASASPTFNFNSIYGTQTTLPTVIKPAYNGTAVSKISNRKSSIIDGGGALTRAKGIIS